MAHIMPWGVMLLAGLAMLGMSMIFVDYAEVYILQAGGQLMFYAGFLGVIFVMLPIKFNLRF